MRRAWIGGMWGLLFLLLAVGMALAADAPGEGVSVADVLRGPYTQPVTDLPVISTADVVRGAYDVPVQSAAMPSTADVLRGAYAPLLVTGAPVATADILRGAEQAPVLLVRAPTADVLRGAYTPSSGVMAPMRADILRGVYTPPAVVAPVTFGAQVVAIADVLRGPYFAPLAFTPWYLRTDVALSGLAVILLLLALVFDYYRHRHPPVAGGFQPPRPSHVH
jgi:hypothetical protein